MPRILLGAAHTLMQPGEIYKDLREADLTRKMLKLAIPHLEKSGYEFKTVPLDLPLLKRIDWINDSGYSQDTDDIFIELHVNDGNKRGVESWYCGDPSDDNPSQRLAEFLLDDMCTVLKFDSQGAKSEHEHELASLLILNQTKTISIATELLYIDNEEDIKILKDDTKLDNLMKTLVDSIKKFFEDIKKTPLKKAPKKVPPKFGGADGISLPPLGAGFGANPSGTIPSFSGAKNATATGTSKSSNLLMDREERKKMIIETYKKIIGKEPNQNDLNYYLNMATSEDELIKKLVDSKDHTDMVKDAGEAKTLREKYEKTESELLTLRSKVKDQQAMLNNLNQLLAHKNLAIQQMQNELINKGVVKNGQFFDPHRKG